MASRSPVAAVRAAARAEKALEKTRADTEREWRQAWWATTMALAEIPARPQSELTEATEIVAAALGQSRSWVSQRRRCGQHFALESEVQDLIPRFAVASAQAKADPSTAADLIRQAEHEGASLREFNAMLTGKSWTQTPENLTRKERIAITRRELQTNADEVLEDDDTREAADEGARRVQSSRRAYSGDPAPAWQDAKHQADRQVQKMFNAPEVPTQHLLSAAGELGSAQIARDIHGLEDETAWKQALAKVRHYLEYVEASPSKVEWTAEDQEFMDNLGRMSS